MNKLKIFISTPMHNKTEEEIERRFFLLTELVYAFCKLATDESFKRENIEVIDNFHHEDLDADAGRLMHLGRSIQQMQDADLVIFDVGALTSSGCSVEKAVCDNYDIPILRYADSATITWLNTIKKIIFEKGE